MKNMIDTKGQRLHGYSRTCQNNASCANEKFSTSKFSKGTDNGCLIWYCF